MTTMWVIWIEQKYANHVGEPEAVFTTKEKAEAYIASTSYSDEFRLEEVPVDPERA